MRAVRCSWCGHEGAVVPVHGHGQCAHCGTNLEPCCSGASALDEAGALGGSDSGPDPALFVRLFDGLGGRQSTVTRDALLFALVQRLGSDLAEAALLLEAGERVGLVLPVGVGLYRLRSA